MKKFLALVSIAAVAAMFTACDDSSSGSDDSGVVSCDVSMSMSLLGNSMNMHYCGEAVKTSESAAAFNQNCGDAVKAQVDKGINLELKKGSGCPGGAAITCPAGDATFYIYDDNGLIDCSEVSDVAQGFMN